MEILTGKLFTAGCQFQFTGSHEKSLLYITGYNSADSLILPDCKYACEYGIELWIKLSRVLIIDPEYRLFHYLIFGENETVRRYYNQVQIVNYTKHL